MSSQPATHTVVVTLAEVEAMANRWCHGCDPALLVGIDAARDAEQLARVIRRLQVKQVALAARAKEANSFSGRFPTAPAWQAHINGCSQSEAKRGLDTVERLVGCPQTAAALEAGELSISEADLVTSAAVVNPGSERRLVDQARKHNFADTRTAADRARHAVFSREQEQARLARMRKLRRVLVGTDGDGLRHLDTHLVPDDWGGVESILDAYTDAAFRQARHEGRREDQAAYRADGLIAALRAAGDAIGVPTPPPPTPTGPGCGSPAGSTGSPSAPTADGTAPHAPPSDERSASDATTGSSATPSGATTRSPEPGRTVDSRPIDRRPASAPPRVSSPVVLVDAIALRRGWASETETCELAGSGTRVSVDWINDVLPTGAVDVLVHDRHDIRAHARVHRRRRPTPDPTGSGPPDLRPTVVVLIDAIALAHPPADIEDDDARGAIAVPGTDLQISRRRLRRLVPDDIAGVVERDLIDLRHHTSSTRHIPRPVRLAVLARDRRCTVPGCRNRQGLERDHVHDFARGGLGSHVNMHGTCADHHDDKTYRDARVVITETERLWYPPPGTPDHPVHGKIPWRAPLGEHLTRWDLHHLPRGPVS